METIKNTFDFSDFPRVDLMVAGAYHWYDKKVVHRQKRCGAYFGRYYANEVRL